MYLSSLTLDEQREVDEYYSRKLRVEGKKNEVRKAYTTTDCDFENSVSGCQNETQLEVI